MSKRGSVLPWSYSSLNTFENCPRRFYLTRISKEVADPPGEAALWGNEVHKALELSVGKGYGLGERFKAYQPVVDRLRAAEGRKYAELKFGVTNTFTPTKFMGSDVWYRGVIDLLVVRNKSAIAIDYKGLALDTPLPTPTGWTTMGDVQVGATLYDSTGHLCTVTGKSEVQRKPCYRITFDDTSQVIADEDHLWCVDGAVRTTKELAARIVERYRDGRPRHRDHTALPAPLNCAEAPLPIHPYVLGVWLGDGKRGSGEVCKPDQELWANIEAAGYSCGPDTYSGQGNCRVSTVYGLRTALRQQGLLGNKHIPPTYLRASRAQREALLQGLMDTGGSVNPTRKQCVFSSCSETLAGQVFELLVSLGQRPLINHIDAFGFGRKVKAFPVVFRPVGGITVFRLTRKAARVGAWGPGLSNRRLVVSVEAVPTVPTQCITVDAPDSTYLCTKHMMVTHNTGSKVKHDGDQLKLFAAATFAQHPYIQTVHTQYLWLAADKTTSKTFTREDVPGIWEEFQPRVARMVLAEQKDRWLPNPTGLCRWCPVGKARCEFWQGRNGKVEDE